MLGNEVDDAGLVAALAVTVEEETIDARLKVVFIVRKGVEMKVEEALAVTCADRRREEEAQETQAVVRMTCASTAEGSHLGFE